MSVIQTTPNHDEAHDPNLAHHFESMPQQRDAVKLGMWLFLATEILLFGGLFCAYAVFRANHPALFVWGEQFMDEKLGVANTAILLISSMTIAMALTYIQRNQRRMAMVAVAVTFMCGTMFMAIKSVEYGHKFDEKLLWGTNFYEMPAGGHGGGAGGAIAATSAGEGDAAKGRSGWDSTCRSCHGASGEGVVGQGMDVRSSTFIQELDDDGLLAFIKKGRLPTDASNTTGILMPPKGGNPLLKDQDLRDIIAHLRTLQIPIAEASDAPATESPEVESPAAESPEAVGEQAAAAAPESDTPAAATQAGTWFPRSSIPNAPEGPAGITERYIQGVEHTIYKPVPQFDPNTPPNAHLFFGIYFLMTGLHGIHVIAGMLVMLWLLWRLGRRDFGSRYYTPVECGALYWHIVDVIWIFLFPLWYLIS